MHVQADLLCRAYTFHYSGYSVRASRPGLREMPKLHIKVAASSPRSMLEPLPVVTPCW